MTNTLDRTKNNCLVTNKQLFPTFCNYSIEENNEYLEVVSTLQRLLRG